MAKADDMDAEVAAIQALISALEPLDDVSRARVLGYVKQRFSLGDPTFTPATGGIVEVPALSEGPPSATSGVVDIRSLKEEKSPRNAVEMSVLVAYYLSELATQEERRDSIGTSELTKYFKQADYRLPSTPRVTLHQAKSAGYLDSASHGQYKLNPVGYNLVAHGLPSASPRKRAAKKTTARKGTRKKTTTRKKSTRKSSGARTRKRTT